MAAMVLGSLLFSLWTARFWILTEIQIKGTSPYTRTYLEAYLKDHRLINQHVLTLNPLKLQEELRKNPLIRDAQIERELLPSRITIRVQERKPAFLVYRQGEAYNRKKAYVIDHEGIVLPLPAETVTEQASNIHVSVQAQLVKDRLPEKQQDILRGLEALWEQKLLPIRGVYNISDPNNLILYQAKPAMTIWLGKPEDLPIKLKLIPATLESAQIEPGAVAYIDLRFWKHPVIKTRS